MDKEVLFYIILSGIVALLLALFQYIYKSKKRAPIYMFLTFLRFVTIFSILLLLINPKFEKVTYYNEKPNLIVAIDNSESVTYLEQDDKVEQFIQALKSNDSLNARFNLDFYVFGQEMSSGDSLSFNEPQSNIALVFDRLAEVYNNSISPTLLITDGNQTYGNDFEYKSRRFKQPVFPIVLGDTITYTDLKIEQLNVNKYAYIKNRFPVEIITTYNGNTSVDTRLQVTTGNTILHTENLRFDGNSGSRIVNLTLPANSVGVKSYKVEIIPLESEKNKINNVKNFGVEVIDQKTNVAIVSNILHPDLGAFKRSIESNEQRQATIITPRDFISRSTEFQMAILYQPDNSFRFVYSELQKLGINRFTVIGSKTNGSALNNLQSNYKQEITRQTEEYQPTLNQNYATFIIDDIDFNDYPPLTSEFGEVTFTVPVEPILFKTINGTETVEPLLATFETAGFKEAILFGEGIWKWRSQSYLEDDTFNNFDNFLGKLVQYLSSNQQRSRLNVNYESFYDGNIDLKIDAQFFNKNYEFDANANLNITLRNKDTNEITTFPFVAKNNSYQVDLSGLEAGEYTFTVKELNENISKSGTFRVLEYNIEQQFLNANVTKLQNVATYSNGNSYFIDNLNMLNQNLLNDSRFSIVQKSNKNIVPLIDWKYLLGLIALSLSAEWFIRKYNGLI